MLKILGIQESAAKLGDYLEGSETRAMLVMKHYMCGVKRLALKSEDIVQGRYDE